jgi:membrane protein
MAGILHKVQDHSLYRRLLIWLKRYKLDDGITSLYDVLHVLMYEIKLDSITKRSGYMAFNFTLAIFPGIIFLFTLIPLLHIPNLQEAIMTFLQDMMPPRIYDAAADTIQDIISKPRGGLLSFGFAFALFMSTNGIMGMMDVFNKKTGTFENRSYLKKRVVAAVLTVALALILFLAMATVFLGTYLLDVLVFYEIVTERFTYLLIMMLKYLAVILLFFLANSLLYHYAPAMNTRWEFFSIGSIVATVLIFLVSLVFSAYINNFDSYNKFYGSIGALIGLMIWLDFISMVLLLGFEINASIDEAKEQRARQLSVTN